VTIKVVYPVPNDNPEVWALFRDKVVRFTDSWRQFGPGFQCDLVPVLFADDPTGKVTNLFHGLPIEQFEQYDGAGCDIGAAQWVAEASEPDDFIVALTSRVYFHRSGWLNHLKEARELYGPGLYGTSASLEGGRLHCCTRCYSMDAEIWNAYPTVIHSRDLGTYFEVGHNNPLGPLSDWVESIGRPAYMVYWSGVRRKPHWTTPDNIFRKGNQEDLLVWDKHTDAYRDADHAEKERLHAMAYGVANPVAEA